MTDLSALEAELTAAVAAAGDLAALDALRVSALGKTGSISNLLKSLGAMSPDERKTAGPAINGLRDRVAALIGERKTGLESSALEAQLGAGRLVGDGGAVARGVAVDVEGHGAAGRARGK